MGKRVVAVRHPMPYGDLAKQRVQRFATIEDLAQPRVHDRGDGGVRAAHRERHRRLRRASTTRRSCARRRRKPTSSSGTAATTTCPSTSRTCTITVVDPHRPGHELRYYPGSTNLLLGRRGRDQQDRLGRPGRGSRPCARTSGAHNPRRDVIDAASRRSRSTSREQIRGKRVLVVEDGPTLTHGGMKYGAGIVAAQKYGAAEIVDPRPYLVGEIAETFRKYPGIGDAAARDGVRRAAGARPRGDDRARAVRPGRSSARRSTSAGSSRSTAVGARHATSCRRSGSRPWRTCSASSWRRSADGEERRPA